VDELPRPSLCFRIDTPTAPAPNRLTAASFDSRGNQRSWAGASHTWNALNQLENTVNGSENWFHVNTASDERLVSVSWNGGFKTLRLRDLENRVLREYKQVFQGGNEVWTVERDYVYRGSTLLATETPTGRRHFHPDHLGTPRMITNATGQAVSFHTYYPFGEEVLTGTQNPEVMRFTGHERDLGSLAGAGDDLDYMHARYCSPLTGRFLGVDPKERRSAVRKPQSWNRFAYSFNNPLRFVDPDGRESVNAIWMVNTHEIAVILHRMAEVGPLKAAEDTNAIKDAGVQAIGETVARFGNNQDNGKENAFQHGLWACLSTCSAGAAFSEMFLIAHETGNAENTEAQMTMDLHNNSVGIALGRLPAVCNTSCAEMVAHTLESGLLMTSLSEASGNEEAEEEDEDEPPPK
jgi:RHS repeat-associated protein